MDCVLLAELRREQVESLYAAERYADRPDERPDPARLLRELKKVRTQRVRPQPGPFRAGCRRPRPTGARRLRWQAVAGLSISMPSVRYDAHRLPSWVASLGFAAEAIESDLAAVPSW